MSQLQNDLMLAHAAFLNLPYILAAIQNGADPLYQHQSGESVALALANLGDDIGVYELAKLEPRVLFQRSAHGETPAIRLAFQNHHTAVVHLARLNPDILLGPQVLLSTYQLAPFLLQLKRRTGGRSSLTLAPLPSELSFHTADLAGQLGTMGAPAGDPGARTLSFRTAGSAAALVWVVSRTVEGVQLLRLGKAGPDHIPRSLPIASPRDLSGSPCGVMRWNRAQGGPDLCTRDMLLYLIYVACRMAKRRPKIKTTVESPQDFVENLRRFQQSDEHEPPCEVPPSEGFFFSFFLLFGALRT